MNTLQLFVHPRIICFIHHNLFAEFFNRFAHLPNKEALPNPQPDMAFYDALSFALRRPGAFPQPLIQALLEIEALAHIDNTALSDESHRGPPCPYEAVRLRTAFRLWLSTHPIPQMPDRGCVRSTSRSAPATAESVPPSPPADPIPHPALPIPHSAA